MSALALPDVRAKAAAALAPVDETDPVVLVDLVDAFDPPVLMLAWSEPWIETLAMGPTCTCWGRLAVLCVAGRLEPGAGVALLENLVALATRRLAADDYPWPLQSITAPRVLEMAGIRYLVARVEYRVPVAL